jgi:Saxitoxin biosynthesis operon protein SxtJ
MKWSDIPRDPSAKILRQFAGAWLVFFLAIGAHQAFSKGRTELGVIIAVAAVLIGGLGLIRPTSVKWIFVGWMMLAFPIGWLVSLITLIILFYGMLTPVALFFRLTGRDPMCRKIDPGESTYWTAKEQPQDMRRYLRQY